MNILALDTATDILSMALQTAKGIWYTEIDGGLHHSERLIPLVDALLAQAQCPREDLELLCCMEGPGSFTGLRIGFATVKGFALALGIPYIAIPTLDCYGWAHRHWPGTVVPLIDAKKHSVFTALYQGGTPISAYLDIEISHLIELLRNKQSPYLFTGPDAPRFYEGEANIVGGTNCYLDPGARKGKARELLEIAQKRYTLNPRGDDPQKGPRYLRKSDAELAKEGNHEGSIRRSGGDA
ncbi:MAG TPA: tRNA (adenosine(37)-N6)-threonylcarbamoyltransferase complex dimerization subunit type 1 TsaB [Termitinemataceae bacterium]|nr:tRNA (adenosine(37)-N6)-threonylcarbamoyltransferase complex dimerization subunit type 1 TsaB [Termitinemataceae bacterium]HOM23573.1 tRNA (adenosine(37)-N6)-threonylcarbamoyltransferase complex dimerization subunit type 1 TsaB [Termitinemataceae bacterium]HPP99846.1 tRNA (adenosine(37)-N6)-threonylcarbamoyltransferase complex dimerization subunit type 1 TsaB [Termitinemataceae bacterium]